jgi:hypothetical protein
MVVLFSRDSAIFAERLAGTEQKLTLFSPIALLLLQIVASGMAIQIQIGAAN